ncbi:MAG: cytochrome c-type biogenesis protein [Casimicrobium sp.]
MKQANRHTQTRGRVSLSGSGSTAIGASNSRGSTAPTNARAISTWAAIVALGFLLTSSFALAQTTTDAALDARVKALSSELRCLVCQNQTVADSDSGVARDMREQVRTQLAAGKSDAEVKTYMTDRFGDFVLYNPPFKATTVVLWLGPFAVLLLAGVLLIRRLRKSAVTHAPAVLSDDERDRARAMLNSKESPN